MRYLVAHFVLVAFLLPTNAIGQDKGRRSKRSPSKPEASRSSAPGGSLKICQGLPIPGGYIIVAYETSSACPHGAYLLKKQATQPSVHDASAPVGPKTAPSQKTVARPRRVSTEQADPVPQLVGSETASNLREPTLSTVPTATAVSAPANNLSSPPAVEEVGEGDVVRIDTNLVTVPVSVMDRDGRFVPNLRREDFRVFENGSEQQIAYFEPTEKPFTVALLLDTSGSTHFHLSHIKEAAIGFAKQLRPQDRVLVVTFNQEVLLLTEATNNINTVSEVIRHNAVSGDSTRLYDAINLVIRERLNKLQGRKAIVLFTDGVDTASYLATYESTLREVEELDALIYPIQYDTIDFLRSMQRRGNLTIVTTTNNWPFPSRSSSRVIYGTSNPGPALPNTIWADYERADQYLNQLANKSGARLYKANDRVQLADAFSKIAEELRRQYSLGYYPQTPVQSGERREIKVRVRQPDLAVRARSGYVQRAAGKR